MHQPDVASRTCRACKNPFEQGCYEMVYVHKTTNIKNLQTIKSLQYLNGILSVVEFDLYYDCGINRSNSNNSVADRLVQLLQIKQTRRQ